MKSRDSKSPASLSAKAKEFVGASSSVSPLQLTTTTQTSPLCDTESLADLWQEPSKDGSAITSRPPFVNEFVPKTQTHQQVQQGPSPSFHDVVGARGGRCNFYFVEFVPHQNKIASNSTRAYPPWRLPTSIHPSMVWILVQQQRVIRLLAISQHHRRDLLSVVSLQGADATRAWIVPFGTIEMPLSSIAVWTLALTMSPITITVFTVWMETKTGACTRFKMVFVAPFKMA
jgi:hypothetical protein